ncbi:hypothetical protein B0F87_11529 [Methylobacter tundripaludum]|uniref:Uncharacterized protein n=1 Tax=Methylobacter tundripaludum TaxID=173365 RepID=A0A2S6H6D5_9GAMM|nr:hypothetical protein B0F87_11529 [Methylobacter tundripaludum]
MRRKAHGFFYALTFVMVGGVLGSPQGSPALDPVYQPDTSSAALSLVAPVGGYIATVKESPMNKLLTWLIANAPLRHQIPVRLFQIRYQRAKRVLRAQLLPLALTREV